MDNLHSNRKLLVSLDELEGLFPPVYPSPGTPQDREKQIFEAGKHEAYLIIERLYWESQTKKD